MNKDTQVDFWDIPIEIEPYGDPDPPCLSSLGEFKRRMWEFIAKWKSILCL